MRRIEAVEPQLIHAHFATDGCAALAIKERLGIPLIVTLHGYDVTSEDAALRKSSVGRAYLRRKKALWKRTDLFICISEFIRQKALERGFPEEKLWVHSIGINLKAFQSEAAMTSEPLVLFVGRLVEVKGCERLLRAMCNVEAQVPEARLVVIGDGPLRVPLEEEACRILKRYEFLGAQNADAVREWMARVAVVVIPSEGREGLSMVALEAQAMQVPVVSFRGPGIAEAVEDGASGVLVTQGDENALADAITTVLKDRDLAARMGARGRKRVEQWFDLHKQTAQLEDKYDAVLGRR
jgi:glycosyltransferase involved in cell wall biosynthesis